MYSVLSDKIYLKLFAAQVVALTGTGLATVALSLLAFDLAGSNAAMVLATVLTIKMFAYVVIAPIAAAFSQRFDRRAFLISLDVIRASTAVCFPFVTETWQVYALIFLLQSASAAFTPAYQATIPDVLPEQERYTQALSLSRLAYELESIVSPLIAAACLTFVSYSSLFFFTSIGFFASAALVFGILLPQKKPSLDRKILAATFVGLKIYIATPRLKGLLGLSFAVSSAGAMVLVNSVAIVRGELGLSESALAWAFFTFGLGSILLALILPKILFRFTDRNIMLSGAWMMAIVLLSLASFTFTFGLNLWSILAAWFLIGFGYSSVQTPAGRLIRKSANSDDRPALFAAQFCLSHCCWLISYPISGWLMTAYGTVTSLLASTVFTTLGIFLALRWWPDQEPENIWHTHENVGLEHPHLGGQRSHSHAIIIDDLHPKWPTRF